MPPSHPFTQQKREKLKREKSSRAPAIAERALPRLLRHIAQVPQKTKSLGTTRSTQPVPPKAVARKVPTVGYLEHPACAYRGGGRSTCRDTHAPCMYVSTRLQGSQMLSKHPTSRRGPPINGSTSTQFGRDHSNSSNQLKFGLNAKLGRDQPNVGLDLAKFGSNQSTLSRLRDFVEAAQNWWSPPRSSQV